MGEMTLGLVAFTVGFVAWGLAMVATATVVLLAVVTVTGGNGVAVSCLDVEV
jgi:hypothetical protein